MKAILIFALVAIAACSEVPVEQDLQSNIVDTIKCFVEKALPLLPQVTEIITALKEQDFMTIMMSGMAMYEDIKEMIDVCIPKEQMLGINLYAFVQCANNVGGITGLIAKLIDAILRGDQVQIAILIPQVLAAGGKIIKQCGHYLR